MGRRSSGVTMKMEVDGGIYQNVPPGFSAADSTRSRIKREVNHDGESVMDDIDNLPLSKRMRMLLAGRPSGSSSGSGSSGKVPKCCVDEDVIEETRPSKIIIEHDPENEGDLYLNWTTPQENSSD